MRVPAGSVQGAGPGAHAVPAFAIARKPVTLGEIRAWAEVSGRRLPQLADANDQAVATDLDWLVADDYARWRSEVERRPYRLPSEIEWVRAARAGVIAAQAAGGPVDPPWWEWTGDCWDDQPAGAEPDMVGRCEGRVLVGGELPASGNWGRAAMGERRPAAGFRLVLPLR